MERDEIDIPGAMRPRTAGAAKTDPHRIPRFRSALLSRISGAGGDKTASASAGREREAGARSTPGLFTGARRCVVKARYVPMNGYGREASRLHLKYLERDGVERDGSPGKLYGVDQNFNVAELAATTLRERNQFRFIVSPEDAAQVDLTTYARDLMSQVERDLGKPLVWGAVNHFNTDQPHVHIVVRGVDRDGKQVRIPPQYISHGMRESAERLLTRQLGLRSERDLARQQSRDVGAERFTALDRGLLAALEPDGTVSPRALRAAARGDRSTFNARLETLERLGLAERRGTSWALADGWDKSLRDLGERGDIIKRMAAAVAGELGPHSILDATPAKPFDGVVRGKGLHDELAGTFFAAVASPAGETYYVRLPAGVAETLDVGDIVRVGAEAESWVKPNDRVVSKFASLNGGIYDPAAHETNLVGLESSRAVRGPSPAVLVAANVRRLERLAKFGLAERLPGGRWKVPADLVHQLEERERAGTPRQQRLQITKLAPPLRSQIMHEGPTWLDRVTDPGQVAGYGFGADLSLARRVRGEFLRRLGVDLGDPQGSVTLQALELPALARALEQRTGRRFDPAPAGMKGVVVPCDPLPSGNAYVSVVDEAAGRFVLIPARAAGPYAAGNRVEIRAAIDGRLDLRQLSDRTRGGAE
jgi:type IV secretory pathway VirD2 relaxase